MYVYVYVYACVCVCMCLYVYVCVCVCMCMYVYVEPCANLVRALGSGWCSAIVNLDLTQIVMDLVRLQCYAVLGMHQEEVCFEIIGYSDFSFLAHSSVMENNTVT